MLRKMNPKYIALREKRLVSSSETKYICFESETADFGGKTVAGFVKGKLDF